MMRDLGRSPIPGPSPAGVDVQASPEWDELELELAKLHALDGSRTDWERVSALCATLLTTTGKDLRLGCRFCAAQLRTCGLEGFADGLRVLKDLVELHWDTMGPARPRARRNALEWWQERMEADLAACEPEVWPGDRREELFQDLKTLDGLLVEHLEEAPSFHALKARLEDLILEKRHRPPPVPPQPAAPQPTAPQAVPASAAPPRIPETAGLDADQLLRQGLEGLRQAAGLLLDRDLSDPLPYRLARLAAWLPVTQTPPAEGGRTRIPSPDESTLHSLQLLHQAANWKDLIPVAESLAGRYLFWLEPSRLSANALQALGHSGAAQALAQEARAYARRLPDLAGLAFADGTPFADAAVQAWLQEGGDPARTARPAAETCDPFAEARQLAASGQLGAALKTLAAGERSASSQRERFRWKSEVCRLLAGARQGLLFRAQARELLQLSEAFRLAEWEPELAMEALLVLAGGLRQPDNADPALLQEVLGRVAALDPSKALGLV